MIFDLPRSKLVSYSDLTILYQRDEQAGPALAAQGAERDGLVGDAGVDAGLRRRARAALHAKVGRVLRQTGVLLWRVWGLTASWSLKAAWGLK